MSVPGVWEAQSLREPARELRVIDHVDVLVAGGGPAGVGAALAAARLGARTTIVDQYGFLGGMWTAGLVTPIWDYQNKGGIVAEIVDRLRSVGKTHRMHSGKEPFDNEHMKYLLDCLCLEAGISLRLHRRVADVVTEAEKVIGVITESKSGREAILARVVIDCTGDGDVCAMAGVPYEKGRPEDGAMQPMSLFFVMANVQWQQAQGASEVFDMLKGVVDSGHSYEIPYARPSIFSLPQPGVASVLLTHMPGYDGTSADDLTSAAIDGRREVQKAMAVFAQTAELGDAVLVATATQVGVRETRHITGHYVLTEEDLSQGRSFPDGICWASFPIDVHSPRPSRGRTVHIEGRKVPAYQIPLRSLIPFGKENLLMAGRCISGTARAHASFRVTGDCVAMGQAAGTAAALAVQTNTLPSRLNHVDVVAQLRSDGVRI